MCQKMKLFIFWASDQNWKEFTEKELELYSNEF